MKKLLFTALATLLATNAFAATYYLSGSGDDNADGTTTATAWATMNKVNSTVLPGDVIIVYPNWTSAYTAISPDNAGTDAGYITFIGASPIGDPLTDLTARGQVVVSEMTLTGNAVSIKGITIAGHLRLGASHDSLTYSTVKGSIYIDGGDYNYVHNNVIEGGARICHADGTYIGGFKCSGNEFIGNSFPNAGTLFGAAQGAIAAGGKTYPAVTGTVNSIVDSLLFKSNSITFDADQYRSTHAIYWLNRVGRSTFSYNTIIGSVISDNGADQLHMLASIGDSCRTLTFNRDSVALRGDLTTGFAVNDANNQVTGVVIDSCHYHFGGAGSSSFNWNARMQGFTSTYTVYVGKSKDPYWFRAPDLKGKNYLRNNTFAVSVNGPALDFRNNGGPGWGADSTLILYGNLIANLTTSFSERDRSPYYGGSRKFGALFSQTDIDSGTVTPADKKSQIRLVSNNNLVWYRGWNATPGDRAFGLYNSTGGQWYFSAPGDSAALTPSRIENTYHCDSLSVHGWPAFDEGGRDTTISRTFDARIAYYSQARAVGLGGEDAGAIAYPTSPEIDLNPIFLSFEQGVQVMKTFDIVNNGTSTLTVTSITVPSGKGFSLDIANASISAGETATVKVTFNGSGVSTYVTIVSDDADEGTILLPLSVGSQQGQEP